MGQRRALLRRLGLLGCGLRGGRDASRTGADVGRRGGRCAGGRRRRARARGAPQVLRRLLDDELRLDSGVTPAAHGGRGSPSSGTATAPPPTTSAQHAPRRPSARPRARRRRAAARRRPTGSSPRAGAGARAWSCAGRAGTRGSPSSSRGAGARSRSRARPPAAASSSAAQTDGAGGLARRGRAAQVLARPREQRAGGLDRRVEPARRPPRARARRSRSSRARSAGASGSRWMSPSSARASARRASSSGSCAARAGTPSSSTSPTGRVRARRSSSTHALWTSRSSHARGSSGHHAGAQGACARAGRRPAARRRHHGRRRTAAVPPGGAGRDGGVHTPPRATVRHPRRSARGGRGPLMKWRWWIMWIRWRVVGADVRVTDYVSPLLSFLTFMLMRPGERAARAAAYERARPEILEHVPRTARRVLDLGCATGTTGAALKQRQDVEVVGDRARARLRARGGDAAGPRAHRRRRDRRARRPLRRPDRRRHPRAPEGPVEHAAPLRRAAGAGRDRDREPARTSRTGAPTRTSRAGPGRASPRASSTPPTCAGSRCATPTTCCARRASTPHTVVRRGWLYTRGSRLDVLAPPLLKVPGIRTLITFQHVIAATL